MRIIVGLGNPGRRYERTRHNVGFGVAAQLAGDLGTRFGPGPAGEAAEIARTAIGGEQVVIARPLTWMNHSGEAAARLGSAFGAVPGDWIIVYDDVSLPLGTIRVRPSGRSAGQKGMESVIAALGTDALARVRIGILGDRQEADLADYVLEPFAPSEREIAEEMVVRGAEAARTIVIEGIDRAMNQFNRREAPTG